MTRRVSFRLNDDLYQKLRRLSDSMSDSCRTAIERYVNGQRYNASRSAAAAAPADQDSAINNDSRETDNDEKYRTHLEQEILFLRDQNQQLVERFSQLHNLLDRTITNGEFNSHLHISEVSPEKSTEQASEIHMKKTEIMKSDRIDPEKKTEKIRLFRM